MTPRDAKNACAQHHRALIDHALKQIDTEALWITEDTFAIGTLAVSAAHTIREARNECHRLTGDVKNSDFMVHLIGALKDVLKGAAELERDKTLTFAQMAPRLFPRIRHESWLRQGPHTGSAWHTPFTGSLILTVDVKSAEQKQAVYALTIAQVERWCAYESDVRAVAETNLKIGLNFVGQRGDSFANLLRVSCPGVDPFPCVKLESVSLHAYNSTFLVLEQRMRTVHKNLAAREMLVAIPSETVNFMCAFDVVETKSQRAQALHAMCNAIFQNDDRPVSTAPFISTRDGLYETTWEELGLETKHGD